MGGYQSDFRIEDVRGEENLPLENSLGGYGVTTGADDNVYELSLSPPLTKEYEAGLPIELRFHKENTDVATLNVDKQGAVSLKKFNGQSLVPLVAGDLKTDLIYKLVFDGFCFQVLTGILPKVDIPTIGSNSQEVRSIQDENIDLTKVFYNRNQNKYLVINGNLIVCSDIRLRKVGGAGVFGSLGTSGTVLKMPVPLDVTGFISWTTLSTRNNPFFCRLSGFGVLTIRGELTSDLDEVVLNFPSYIAKMPIEFPQTPVFDPLPQP
ncbi:hypothetical protein HN014_04125 [Aquimarina sp. TRL1]|uniref:hypothetical protein n=1 Tax=Aquimarina sp. (strain TRL1) TaxID=2736252 RepID=UPI001588BECA|nr:hypothetical protein [Aquimarina sp. TRL1]QKX04125.1 hypothetical protein HN014_04125 [Aquimarina sp. TRL1]